MGVSALGKAARANEALILSEDALYEFIAGCKYNPRYEIDDTAEVRFAASRALGVQNTQPEANISMLINALQDEDKELRVETAKALGEQKTLPETAILALTDALQDSNDEVKIEAAQALSGQSTPLPEATISILIHGLQDKSKKIRYWTANVLSNRKETLSEAHISALINVLQDEDESIKVLAAMALVNQETLPEAAIPILSNLLQDDNKDFRSLVANALQKHSRLPEAIISALSKALQDDHQTSRLAAVIALGGQSTLSEVAISALCNALQDKSVKSMVRSMVVPILGRQSVLSEAAILALSNAALKDDNKKIRLQATVTLKNQSMLPESVIIALGDALNDSYNYVRMWAAMVLGDQNTLPEKAIFALIGALQDKDEGVSYIAADILRAQKTLPEVATRSLSEILSAGDNEYIKSAAAIGLLSPNSLSETAISALTGALFDKNKGIRFIAAIGLSMQITLSEVTLSALSNALQDEYEQVRFVAAMALSNQSVLPEATIFALISALQDDCEYVGFAAAKALRVQKALSDVAISALNDKLQDHSKEISSAAASTIDEQNILPEAAVSALSKSLQDENKEVRCGAAAVLGIQKVLPEAVISALINVLQDEDEGVRSIAANALVGQKMLSEAAISTLSNALQDNCEAVKLDTVRALAGQNTLPETAIAALSRALQDDIEEEVRFAVAEVLIGQKELPEVAISALNNALQDGYEEVRVAAVIALSRQKVLSETAISALSEVLQGTEENMKAAAITALSEQKVLPECAISALIYTLQDDNTHMRFIAAKALSQQKSLSEQAISALTQALWSSNASVRHVIVVALRGQKTLSENVISALIHSLQDEDSEVRYAAIDVLREQNTLSEDAILVLIHALKDNDEAVRFAAARVLSRENTQPEATTLALSKALLKDDSGRVRGAAARALRGQKALPKVALSALIHALQDDTKEVRSAAVWALGWNIEQIYSLLPSLELDELQTLYAKFFLIKNLAEARAHKEAKPEQADRLYKQVEATLLKLAEEQGVKPSDPEVRMSETLEQSALRQLIAKVYFEHGAVLNLLKQTDSAQASYQQAQAWGNPDAAMQLNRGLPVSGPRSVSSAYKDIQAISYALGHSSLNPQSALKKVAEYVKQHPHSLLILDGLAPSNVDFVLKWLKPSLGSAQLIYTTPQSMTEQLGTKLNPLLETEAQTNSVTARALMILKQAAWLGEDPIPFAFFVNERQQVDLEAIQVLYDKQLAIMEIDRDTQSLKLNSVFLGGVQNQYLSEQRSLLEKNIQRLSDAFSYLTDNESTSGRQSQPEDLKPYADLVHTLLFKTCASFSKNLPALHQVLTLGSSLARLYYQYHGELKLAHECLQKAQNFFKQGLSEELIEQFEQAPEDFTAQSPSEEETALLKLYAQEYLYQSGTLASQLVSRGQWLDQHSTQFDERTRAELLVDQGIIQKEVEDGQPEDQRNYQAALDLLCETQRIYLKHDTQNQRQALGMLSIYLGETYLANQDFESGITHTCQILHYDGKRKERQARAYFMLARAFDEAEYGALAKLFIDLAAHLQIGSRQTKTEALRLKIELKLLQRHKQTTSHPGYVSAARWEKQADLSEYCEKQLVLGSAPSERISRAQIQDLETAAYGWLWQHHSAAEFDAEEAVLAEKRAELDAQEKDRAKKHKQQREREEQWYRTLEQRIDLKAQENKQISLFAEQFKEALLYQMVQQLRHANGEPMPMGKAELTEGLIDAVSGLLPEIQFDLLEGGITAAVDLAAVVQGVAKTLSKRQQMKERAEAQQVADALAAAGQKPKSLQVRDRIEQQIGEMANYAARCWQPVLSAHTWPITDIGKLAEYGARRVMSYLKTGQIRRGRNSLSKWP
ncbi:hypothetical protein BGZ96_002154 [Linnemannia gamsii]|uniref:ARM repeat-containing protein n=1 Tax=Linnemannia gamsii TaxID=64522 RepID=A0ABQ7KFA0_9FUNG|nr:hypothetical protein BGZ96_002154 [Linnemannia gamsii]